MAHAQKPDLVFRRNGRVHLNRRRLQFSRLLAAEVCATAVVMLDKPCSEAVWRVLATHSIRQFPLHFPSRASPCAITFQLASTAELLVCKDLKMLKHSRIEKCMSSMYVLWTCYSQGSDVLIWGMIINSIYSLIKYTLLQGCTNTGRRCHEIFVAPQYGNCLLSTIWRLEFCKICEPLPCFYDHCYVHSAEIAATLKFD
jgi:hypothetical protein